MGNNKQNKLRFIENIIANNRESERETSRQANSATYANVVNSEQQKSQKHKGKQERLRENTMQNPCKLAPACYTAITKY